MPASPAPDRSPASSRSALAVVFTTILIDFVGFSVLIPVLPIYAARLGARPFEVGLILSVYALAQLLFLPAWGWVSDRFGRRPVILVSLFGTALSFVVLALANSVEAIYAARILGGFFAASIGTAQAIVMDLTPPADRAWGMGLLGAAAVGLLAIAAVPSYGWFYAVGPIIAVGIGVAFPSFMSLYSKACHEEQAGELLGESQSMATAGRIVGPVWAGLALGRLSPAAPFVIAGGLLLVAVGIFVRATPLLVGELD